MCIGKHAVDERRLRKAKVRMCQTFMDVHAKLKIIGNCRIGFPTYTQLCVQDVYSPEYLGT